MAQGMIGRLEGYSKLKGSMQSLYDPFAGNDAPYRDHNAHCQGENVRGLFADQCGCGG